MLAVLHFTTACTACLAWVVFACILEIALATSHRSGEDLVIKDENGRKYGYLCSWMAQLPSRYDLLCMYEDYVVIKGTTFSFEVLKCTRADLTALFSWDSIMWIAFRASYV